MIWLATLWLYALVFLVILYVTHRRDERELNQFFAKVDELLKGEHREW